MEINSLQQFLGDYLEEERIKNLLEKELESFQGKLNESSSSDLMFEWHDSKPTGAVGWIVFDRIINQISGGGIFMHVNATQQETVLMAQNMSRKFTVTDPQIGGAKAGIRFDHQDPRAKGVLKRFLEDNQMLLRNVWVTAADVNVDENAVAEAIQEFGLVTSQSVLGRAIANQTRSKDRSKNLASLLQLPASPYFPLSEGAVGYGIACSIKKVLELTNPSLLGKARVIIQGFGSVGTGLAYFLQRDQIAKVVGISDKDGYIHHSEGIDVMEILEARKKTMESLLRNRGSKEKLNQSHKNMFCNLDAAIKAKYRAVDRRFPEGDDGDEQYLQEFLRAEKAEIVCPCALHYQVTNSIVSTLNSSTWRETKFRYLIPGANNPYGVQTVDGIKGDVKGDVLKKLRKEGVCVLADWVANCGMAQIFHRALSIDFDLHDPSVSYKVLEAVGRPIVRYIEEAFKVVHNQKDYLEFGCSKIAQKRLSNPIPIKPVNQLRPMQSMYSLPISNHDTHLNLSTEERYARCTSFAEIDNIYTKKELTELIQSCPNPVAYDGFEPSGRMHIAQGFMKKWIMEKMTSSGFTYLVWIADWFAYLNHKMDGDLEKIRTIGKYHVEVWKALGLDMSRVRFLWASEEIKARREKYWSLLMEISTKFTVNTIKSQVLNKQVDDPSISQIFNPCMQIADIFFLGVDVCQLGTDQLKINLLAREFAEVSRKESPDSQIIPPIILSNHLLMGLQGQPKMSKSEPNSAIFMDDSQEVVDSKVKNAICPPKSVKGNPCLEYMKYIVFEGLESVTFKPQEGKVLRVFHNYDQLETAYIEGEVGNEELKENLAYYLNTLLEPVRKYFSANPYAKELQQKVNQYFN